MNVVLTNPAGFLALLGLPTVILIHFLQRQAKVIPISTLFLLDQTQRESVSGRRFDRITNSIPLWLQLLMVLLLTWLLVEPRYLKPASTQQVAVVLDSSASMRVFKEKLISSLRQKLPSLQGSASRLQLYLFESEADKPIIYAGDDLEEAIGTVENWTPAAGAIDPNNALRLARSRVNREGILIYVSDTSTGDLPFNAQGLAVGEPRNNVGFTGVAFTSEGESIIWKALLRNYSDSEQTRTWQVAFEDGSKTKPRSVTLKKNSMITVSAAFPAESKSLRVVLTPDEFSLDDQLPLVVPTPKTLKFFAQTSPKFKSFATRFARSTPNLEEINDASEADLSFASYDPLLPVLPSGDSIVVVDETTQSRKHLRGGIVAEKHPLMDGLNWQALLVRESIQIQLDESDDILLWQGDRPLIALRTSIIFDTPDGQAPTEGEEKASPRRARQLIFNFDPTLSNALKLPALVILLHRFSEGLRERKIALEVRNTESGQQISLSTRTGPNAKVLQLHRFDAEGKVLESQTIPLTHARYLRAPSDPGFFRITQGEELLLDSGCHFADTREADLRNCVSEDLITGLTGEAVERNTREDHFWRLWVLLVLCALLLAWHFTKERPRDEEEPTAEPQPS
jgi:hypothetical protein